MKTILCTVVFTLISILTFAGGVDEMSGAGVPVTSITLWTTEEQPERIAVQEEIAADFRAVTGVSVEVVPVSENELGARATAAFAAGELPDIIYAPLANVVNWSQEGIADPGSATEVVNNLGADSFAPGVLSLVESNNEYAAVPVDGWTQLLVYRKDLFEQNNLAPPTTYDAIVKAIEVLHDPPNLYGFVAATDPSQTYMMQVLEHIGLANGVDIVDDSGNVSLDTPETIEMLEFYKVLTDASPEGNLFWQQSRELYLDGRAAMIVWSPFIMDELAGLRDSAPVTFTSDPTSDDLAKRTDFITRIAGPSNPGGSGYADVRYLVITVDAAARQAEQFVEYSLSGAYAKTLAIAPEGKFPVRRGDSTDAQRFVKEWSNLAVGVDRRASLASIYPPEVIQNIVEGLNTGSRWGFSKGEGALYARVNETRSIADITRHYTDGSISAEEAARLMQEDTEELMQ
ncbi:MAG: ABC transporter substrate-binding protein [Salinispira sp.]